MLGIILENARLIEYYQVCAWNAIMRGDHSAADRYLKLWANLLKLNDIK